MAILDILKKDKGEKKPVVKEQSEEQQLEKKISLKSKEVSEAKKIAKVSFHNVIKRPRITEKAAVLAEKGVYTFEIAPKATKIEVARAIKAIYNVEPRKVSISRLPAKRKMVRGTRGKTSAIKKALVYLKEGDTIEFV